VSVQGGDQAIALPEFALDATTVLHLSLLNGVGIVLGIELIGELDLAGPV
jgi:hypothetical protein